jgi:hypothetical protein
MGKCVTGGALKSVFFDTFGISAYVRCMSECCYSVYLHTVYVRVLLFCISAYSVCQSVAILYICIQCMSVLPFCISAYSVCQCCHSVYLYKVYVRVLPFCISAYIQCMSECCHSVYLHTYSASQGVAILYICIHTCTV